MDINNVSEHILNRMPEGLSQIEQARYIYIELGKLVSFDEGYWLGNRREKEKIYKSSRKIKEFKDLKSNKVICVSLSKLYNSLLNKIGIEAIEESEEEVKFAHVYSSIIIDGKIIKVDLQKDLKNIQAKLRIMHFDEEREATSKMILRKIDEKIGYSYDGEKKLKEIIERVKSRSLKCENFSDKIKIVLEEIESDQDILKMEYTEKMYFYDKIISLLFRIDGNKLAINDMIKEGKEKRYTRCISVRDKDGTIKRFIYSEKAKIFLQITDLKLRELIKEGLNPMYNARILGLKDKTKKDTNQNR